MRKRIISMFLILILLAFNVPTFSHSGKTDSSGGHKDNKNKSGLGSYHYHCGGNPAHLHKNGECPYSTKKTSTTSKTTSTTASKVDKATIKAIQTKLNSLGYKCGTPDGIMGNQTKEAIKKYQKDKGLKVDGQIKPQLKKALGLE